jgi:molecular chaperone DnaK (HSP70)
LQVTTELILGIDLGTTFSTAAAVIDGKFQYALDARGEACVPSVVHFPKAGAPLVGFEADKLRSSDPTNTIFGIKRVIARALDSKQARLLDAASAFRLKGIGTQEVTVQTRQGNLAASEIAAIIVRHLKERAEARFGKTFNRAVMTVPVVASEAVREAMTRIGRIAGLDVERVISEPVAGGLARGLGGKSVAQTPMLVYDFGGGTLDASIVQREGEAIRVLSAGGDDCLGGDDLDSAFAKWVAGGVWAQFQLDVTKDVILSDRIQRQCELVKRALSSKADTRFIVPDALGIPGRRRTLDVPVHREQLVPVWDELVARSMTVTAQTLVKAGLRPKDLGGIYLIGGTTFVPQVRDSVARTFSQPLNLENDPQTAVARGAALLAVFPNMVLD